MGFLILQRCLSDGILEQFFSYLYCDFTCVVIFILARCFSYLCGTYFLNSAPFFILFSWHDFQIGTHLFIFVRTVFIIYALSRRSSENQCWGSDPHVFGPPGSGSVSQRYGSGSVSQRYGSGSFPFLIKVLSGLK
jgi:hypothetical protein